MNARPDLRRGPGSQRTKEANRRATWAGSLLDRAERQREVKQQHMIEGQRRRRMRETR